MQPLDDCAQRVGAQPGWCAGAREEGLLLLRVTCSTVGTIIPGWDVAVVDQGAVLKVTERALCMYRQVTGKAWPLRIGAHGHWHVKEHDWPQAQYGRRVKDQGEKKQR